ncbi:hypothetical protein CPB86DRAFT_707903 [Serendipita vermifera]|nr:hypothetical protein CPB86DRAFT_707903 [Serendipita vermifera]
MTNKSSTDQSSSAVERREASPGPAPPSYNVATSTSHEPGPQSPLFSYYQQRAHDRAQQQQGGGPNAYEHYTYGALTLEREREIRRRTRKRFWKALLIAALIYILGAMFIRSLIWYPGDWSSDPPHDMPIDVPPKSPSIPDDNPRTTPEQPHPPSRSPPGEAYPAPYEGKVLFCHDASKWAPTPPGIGGIEPVTPNLLSSNDIELSTGDPDEHLPYAAYSNFSLPVNVPVKSIYSSGRHASGSINLRARKLEDADRISIIIQASYRYEKALLQTTKDYDGTKDIRFTIDVLFPKNSEFSHSPRNMGKFTSSFSWFQHHVETLDDVSFEELVLSTSSDKIHSSGLIADRLVGSASNGAITGTYNVSTAATISTTNAKIDVDINAFNHGDVPPKGLSIVLSTTNGVINSRANLYSVSDDLRDGEAGSGGKFEFIASTKNSPVEVKFPVAPVNSTLKCTVSTSNGDANVYMHPTYEGSVVLTTSNGMTKLHQEEGIKDPAGLDRPRIIKWNVVSRWAWMGWIGWGEQKKVGELTVSSSNGAIVLHV